MSSLNIQNFAQICYINVIKSSRVYYLEPAVGDGSIRYAVSYLIVVGSITYIWTKIHQNTEIIEV